MVERSPRRLLRKGAWLPRNFTLNALESVRFRSLISAAFAVNSHRPAAASRSTCVQRWNAASRRVGYGCGLPPDLDCAFGDLFGIAFGEVDPPAVDLAPRNFPESSLLLPLGYEKKFSRA